MESDAPGVIRSARLEDAERLSLLSTQLGYQADARQIAGRLERIQEDPAQAVLVLEADGVVQAWIHLVLRDLLVDERLAEVEGLVVDAGRRGRGCGQALMGQAEAWARRYGCRAVTLRSNVIRQEAHRFYENLGYTCIKSQKVFIKEL